MNSENYHLPVPFRVIGVGNGIDDIINKVRSFGFEGVSTETVNNNSGYCQPTDLDKLAIIVSVDGKDTAGLVAKTFHDAGVLTIGITGEADTSCYDSVMQDVSASDIPAVIKTILQPVVEPGVINYEFYDLYITLLDCAHFTVRSVIGDDFKGAVDNLRRVFDEMNLDSVDYLSLHIYFNPKRSSPLHVDDLAFISELESSLPETVCIIWSVNRDHDIKDNEIRVSAILAGKQLGEIKKTVV